MTDERREPQAGEPDIHPVLEDFYGFPVPVITPRPGFSFDPEFKRQLAEDCGLAAIVCMRKAMAVIKACVDEPTVEQAAKLTALTEKLLSMKVALDTGHLARVADGETIDQVEAPPEQPVAESFTPTQVGALLAGFAGQSKKRVDNASGKGKRVPGSSRPGKGKKTKG